ncbi:hypothetical protein [Fictibacillus sp. KU28468]|uniref:hypothetical protein n=1 Tax=Fictibacillus sp. KU28468 TaxID=2991053 RepID=UPI00223E44F3|nr:hypothetical protein [Fictibacillus sp. KU28468]UZJ79563.1 hypothetical protein OKX00_03505 [Fictibacillus sp. KU28468]
MVNTDGMITVKVELPTAQKVNTGLSDLSDIDFAVGAFTNEFGVTNSAINIYDLTKVSVKINTEISTVALADNDANGKLDRAILTLTEVAFY